MKNATTEAEILDEAVRRIRERFHPLRVVLFGSLARGEAREDSDFDLLVVLRDAGNWRTAGDIQGLLWDLPAAFDIIVAGAEAYDEWRRVPVAFEHVVDREGRVIHDVGA